VRLPDLRHPLSPCIEMLLSLLFALVSEPAGRPRRIWVVRRSGGAN